MNQVSRWIAAATLACGVFLSVAGCADAPAATAKKVEPATVEAIDGTAVKKLTLTDKAVERLALTTVAVANVAAADNAAAGAQLTMPYSALLYLPDGTTFAYTNPEGHVYIRETVEVAEIAGDQALLVSGPAAGTNVVTTGGTELWGLEFGIK